MIETFEDIIHEIDPFAYAVERYGFDERDLLLLDLLLQTTMSNYNPVGQPPAKRRSLDPSLNSPLKELNVRQSMTSQFPFESNAPVFPYHDDVISKFSNVKSQNDFNLSADVADVPNHELDEYLYGAIAPLASTSENIASPVPLSVIDAEGSDHSQSSIGSMGRDKKRESLESSISGISSASYELEENNNQMAQNDKTTFRCKICHRVMKRLRIFQQHMAKHEEESMATGGRYQCEKCGERFPTKIFKREHIMREHSEGKTKLFNYHCDICNRTFAQRSNLDVHMRQHTGERPYKCTICSRRFRQKAHLDKHMEKLHDIDVRSNKSQARQLTKVELKCGKCSAVFETRFKLRVHEKTHASSHMPAETAVAAPNNYDQRNVNSIYQQTYDSQIWNPHHRSRSVTPTTGCQQLVKSEFQRPNSEPLDKNYSFQPIFQAPPNGINAPHFAPYDNFGEAMNSRSLTRHLSADNIRQPTNGWVPPFRM